MDARTNPPVPVDTEFLQMLQEMAHGGDFTCVLSEQEIASVLGATETVGISVLILEKIKTAMDEDRAAKQEADFAISVARSAGHAANNLATSGATGHIDAFAASAASSVQNPPEKMQCHFVSFFLY